MTDESWTSRTADPPIVTRHCLHDIVRALGGEVAGDAQTSVEKVATLEAADRRSIVFFVQERFLPELARTKATAVILAPRHRAATSLPRIVCSNPHAYFARVAALLHPLPLSMPGVHPLATVHASAQLAPDVSVGPNAVVAAGARVEAGAIVGAHCYVGEHAVIGAGTRLWPGVVVYHACQVGARCQLHAGVVIGADGFGNAWEANEGGGQWVKVPQVGRAIVGDDVEIGANTTVDRGAIEDTVIEEGVRLDNLIMIAHNVRIGAHTAIAACSGVAGSTRIGKRCRIGGAVGISGHLSITDDVEIAGKTLITKSIAASGSYSGGYPFEETRQWRRNAVQIRHLDDLVKQVKQMEKRLAELERKNA